MDDFSSILGKPRPSTVLDQLEIGDELFWEPDRLVQFEHWVGHIPIAFWLIRKLLPRVLVELGTHRGNSYCAFCQAIAVSGVDCRAYAVDTWQGDKHMAFEAGLLDDLKQYHDPRYSAFSTLMPLEFTEARPFFADGSIDLLHIDGTHTYKDVRADFETWASALSDRGVVLFHDTGVRRADYGVWRLWLELSAEHPHFEFFHSYGLGILGIGRNLPTPVANLLAMSAEPEAARWVRSLFAWRGQTVTLRLARETLETQLAAARTEAASLQHTREVMQALEAELSTARAEAASLQHTRETLETALSAMRAPSTAAELGALRQALESAHAGARAQAQAVRIAGEEMAKADVRIEALTRATAEAQAAAAELDVQMESLKRTHDAQMDSLKRAHAEARLAAEAWRQEHARIASSTFWQITYPLRRAFDRIPLPIKRLGRRCLRLLWWIATLQILRRLYLCSRLSPVPDQAVASIPVFPKPREELDDARSSPASLLDPVLLTAEEEPDASGPSATPELVLPGPNQESNSPAKRADEVPGQLPDLFPLRLTTPTGRIAVVLHLYYSELWTEFRGALAAIPEPFDLFVTLTEGYSDQARDWICESFPSSFILVFPNRGRDVFPFVALVNSGVLFRYELICKLHTKRSLHSGNGDCWRRTLTGGLLQDRTHVERIINAFGADSDLGVAVADGNVIGQDSEYWTSNLPKLNELLERIGQSAITEGATFPAGSIYWIRPFLLRSIAALKLTVQDFEPEPLAFDGTIAHAFERFIGVICHDAGMRIVETSALAADPVTASMASATPPKVHLIAYYLPQFHPTVENNAWWGEGFTEWTNVTRARPQFRGHRQPRLPSDLGFYDLRLTEVRTAQAELARSHGLSAFCYYYYWFDGRSLLRRPLDEVLASGAPDFPFLLCWANEPWTRNWDGLDDEVLLPQEYQPGWVRAFAADVAPALRDPRYFRLLGEPVLLIYRVMNIPNRRAAFAELRSSLMDLGVGPVHLAGTSVAFPGDDVLPVDPAVVGLDAYFEFPPHGLRDVEDITSNIVDADPGFVGHVYDYAKAVDGQLEALAEPCIGTRHRCVMAGWDNTARRGGASYLFHGATPTNFRRWLRGVVQHELRSTGPSERIVFINAWNEWAEGTYLEPEQDFGHGWLEAAASAVGRPTCSIHNESSSIE